MGISEVEWSNYTPEEQAKLKEGYRAVKKSKLAENSAPDGSRVQLQISGGKVTMPPFTETRQYSPFTVEVANGDCTKVDIKSADGDKTTKMQVCYYGKTIYIDPSRYDPNKAQGSIQLHYSPIWDRGFTYQNVSSTGYVHLTNVNVVVKRYDNHEPESES